MATPARSEVIPVCLSAPFNNELFQTENVDMRPTRKMCWEGVATVFLKCVCEFRPCDDDAHSTGRLNSKALNTFGTIVVSCTRGSCGEEFSPDENEKGFVWPSKKHPYACICLKRGSQKKHNYCSYFRPICKTGAQIPDINLFHERKNNSVSETESLTKL